MTHFFHLSYEPDFASPQILPSVCTHQSKQKKETSSLFNQEGFENTHFQFVPHVFNERESFFPLAVVAFGHRFSKLHNMCFASFFKKEVFVAEKYSKKLTVLSKLFLKNYLMALLSPKTIEHRCDKCVLFNFVHMQHDPSF